MISLSELLVRLLVEMLLIWKKIMYAALKWKQYLTAFLGRFAGGIFGEGSSFLKTNNQI